jgi:hypothetical protein
MTDVDTAAANLVFEIERLPNGARWAVADFIDEHWPANSNARGTAMWLAFVALVRAVDAQGETP